MFNVVMIVAAARLYWPAAALLLGLWGLVAVCRRAASR